MSETTTTSASVPPAFDAARSRFAAAAPPGSNKRIALYVVAGIAATVVGMRACSPQPTAQAATPQVPVVLEHGTTTTAAAQIDPLINMGQMTPTAAALVGADFEARRELARKASEAMTNSGRDQCSLYLGATTGGSWELSTSPGVAHPVPVFAGCPGPTTTTASTVKPGS